MSILFFKCNIIKSSKRILNDEFVYSSVIVFPFNAMNVKTTIYKSINSSMNCAVFLLTKTSLCSLPLSLTNVLLYLLCFIECATNWVSDRTNSLIHPSFWWQFSNSMNRNKNSNMNQFITFTRKKEANVKNIEQTEIRESENKKPLRKLMLLFKWATIPINISERRMRIHKFN